jgi:hypothetical protein
VTFFALLLAITAELMHASQCYGRRVRSAIAMEFMWLYNVVTFVALLVVPPLVEFSLNFGRIVI